MLYTLAGIVVAALLLAAPRQQSPPAVQSPPVQTAPPAQKGKPKAFEGAWVMDIQKSKNLPPSFQRVSYYQMVVRIGGDTGDTLKVSASLKSGEQEVSFPDFSYLTNGKETHRVDSLRGSERWSTAKWSEDGRTLTIDSRVKLTTPGGPAGSAGSAGSKTTTTTIQKDVWTLPTPLTLQIATTHQAEGTDSVRTETRIYKKTGK